MQFKDRIIGVLTYFTFGFFGLIWLVFAYMTKQCVSSDTRFNVYQSIFISITITIITMLYGFFISFASLIPYVDRIVLIFDKYVTQIPICFGLTLSNMFMLMLLIYLVVLLLLGKRPYIPYVSDIIVQNFGE